mgnify:CR=1 FL=1
MKIINNFWKYTFTLILIFLVGFLYFQMKTGEDSLFDNTTTINPSEEEDLVIEVEPPRHPVPEIISNVNEKPDLIALPQLNESDEYLHLTLSGFLDDKFSSLIVKTRLIEKIVATIDNLPREYMNERMRPIGFKVSTFEVESQENLNGFILSTKNYVRYEVLVNGLSKIDINLLADTYLRFYPLLQEAYEDLGYPGSYFNDRVIEVIDHLIDTPEINDPIIVHRPYILYEFAHPDIEALSSGQKLLLRLGARNSSRVKQFLKEFRALIS